MDYRQSDSTNNLNIPLIYVSPAEKNNEKLKQNQQEPENTNPTDLFDEVLSKFDFESIILTQDVGDSISNDKYNFNKSNDFPASVPNINVYSPAKNPISMVNSNSSNKKSNNKFAKKAEEGDEVKRFY